MTMIVDHETRKHLLDAIECMRMAQGWLSSSAPADKDYPTERIGEALAHITAALDGGDDE